MCGLNLVIGKSGAGDLIDRMNRCIAHRGIRSQLNLLANNSVGLGHVRLPIVGLAKKYDCPYIYDRWAITLVGEITNFRRIDPDAESDVAFLAERWVRDPDPAYCFRGLDGFWAFVAVDMETGATHIVTDFLAKKPLYARDDGYGFAISSEIAPLLELGPITRDPLYFSSIQKWGYHIGDRTYAHEIRKLPSSAHWIIHPNQSKYRKYIYDELRPAQTPDLRGAIEDAVRDRIESCDVPLAVLASGGLDSSIVLQLAREIRPDVRVFHADNYEAQWLEYLNIDPANLIYLPTGLDLDLDEVLEDNEGPVDLGSMLPQAQLARSIGMTGIHVAMSGDGADELFGGYRRAREYDSQASDVFEELVYYHLPRLDKLMMSRTIELRSPFLSRFVIEQALALPREDRTEKRILKRIFAGIVPAEIVDRPKQALKSAPVLDDKIAWRRKLVQRFEERMFG